jgi:hypothetical protein
VINKLPQDVTILTSDNIHCPGQSSSKSATIINLPDTVRPGYKLRGKASELWRESVRQETTACYADVIRSGTRATECKLMKMASILLAACEF